MSLIDDARAAHKAGLSYGYYMTAKTPSKAKPKVDNIRRCANCGDPLVGGRIRFCSNECKLMKKRRERMEEFSEAGNQMREM